METVTGDRPVCVCDAQELSRDNALNPGETPKTDSMAVHFITALMLPSQEECCPISAVSDGDLAGGWLELNLQREGRNIREAETFPQFPWHLHSLLQMLDVRSIQNQDVPWLTRFSLEPSSLAVVESHAPHRNQALRVGFGIPEAPGSPTDTVVFRLSLKFHRLEVLNVFRRMTSSMPNTFVTTYIVSPGAPVGRFSWSPIS